MSDDSLVRLPGRGKYSKAHFIDPIDSGYILVAAVIDRRSFFGFLLESARKKQLLRELRPLVASIEGDGVEEATLLKALLVPPGQGAYLKKRPDANIARFDVVILVRTRDVTTASRLLRSAALENIVATVRRVTKDIYTMLGSNVRRLAIVNHRRPGVFLFNYFFAASERQNLEVFDYTAGWFQEETGLDNSELMRPLEQEGARYTVVNHARWNRLTDVLPSLLFKPSFPKYVLKHFEANRTAAMPILYRLA